jgi:hypothetical protein
LINIHGIVGLEIDESFPWRNDWLTLLGDMSDIQFTKDLAEPKNCIRLIYDKKLPIQELRNIGDGLYVKKNAVYDEMYRTLIERDDDGKLLLRTDSPSLEWMFWPIQLSLLASASTLVHGAAAEKDGRAILFASWGGVGKTALVAGFVSNMEWKLLGDDLVILTSDEKCCAFPKPMVLYPYHKSVFPDVFAKGNGPVAPVALNGTLTHLAAKVKPFLRLCPYLLQYARHHNPQSVRVNPSAVFGMENISTEATLDKVVWLDRITGIQAPEIHADDGTLTSRMMGSTIRELGGRCGEVICVAMGVGIVDSDSVYAGWIRSLNNATKSCRKYVIYLPSEMPVKDVPDAIHSLLRQKKAL